MFCIYINNLGSDLNSSGLGIDLGVLNVSTIFFADDIILIAKTKDDLNTLLSITRTYFHSHKLQISSKKTKIITFDASTGKTNFNGTNSLSPISFDAVLSFKYLGIPLSSSPYNLFKSFNEQVKQKASNYVASVLSLVRSGPDRSKLAHTLWTQVALPSILYGSNIIPLTQATISDVERCQSLVGKFILQLPRNTSNSCSYLDAGLKPIWSVISHNVLTYSYSVMHKPSSYWPKIALQEQISCGTKSAYTRYLLKWKTATNSFNLNPKQIKTAVDNSAKLQILRDQQSTCSSTFAMNGPAFSSKCDWFIPKPWVNDSYSSQLLAEFRACNSGLGNRAPTKNGLFFKLCPLCSKVGLKAINNEVKNYMIHFKYICKIQVHMLIDCPQMSFYRDSCTLGLFINSYRKIYPSISSLKLFALFLSDKLPSSMKKKSISLYHMKTGWHSLMEISL